MASHQEARASVFEELRAQGMTRRGFLQFCTYLSTLLALPAAAATDIERALQTKGKRLGKLSITHIFLMIFHDLQIILASDSR